MARRNLSTKTARCQKPICVLPSTKRKRRLILAAKFRSPKLRISRSCERCKKRWESNRFWICYSIQNHKFDIQNVRVGEQRRERRHLVNSILGALLALMLWHTSVQSADKVRISMTGFAGQFMTFPLAQSKG